MHCREELTQEVRSNLLDTSLLRLFKAEIRSIEVAVKWKKKAIGHFAQESKRSRAIPLEIMIITLTNVKTF